MAPGEVVGIDRRQASLSDARTFARERGVANVAFEVANVYQLPFPDRSFDAAFACALLQHLAAPLAALKEIRRVLKPGGVIGIVDGSSTITFRYPRNRLLEAWDRLRALQREGSLLTKFGQLKPSWRKWPKPSSPGARMRMLFMRGRVSQRSAGSQNNPKSG